MNDKAQANSRRRQLQWDTVLKDGHKPLRLARTLFKHLPSDPRCKLCIAPFGGVGGRVSGLIGFAPSRMNPNFCANCLEALPPGGTELEMAVLFADVRGSTALGEESDPTTFAGLMNRFYGVATQVLIAHDALIDKLIGDEVMALFLPGLCGIDYRQKACDAALALLRAVRADADLAMRLTIGAGVHAGPAFVGNVGGEGVFDFTALGDTINVGARLQSQAASGELVVSDEMYRMVKLPAAQMTTVMLKGKDVPLAIRKIQAT